jgi:enediyne biosynthesis protein E4
MSFHYSMLKKIYLLGIIVCTAWHCAPKDKKYDALFQSLDSSQTGLLFNNHITSNDSVNLLSYEYMYNGGGVGVGNFDGNDLPDLFFTGNMVESKIYINKGMLRFEDITAKSKINTKNKWCRGVSVVDINNDGYDDIYVSVGGHGNKSEYPNLLYINNKDLTFRESAAAYGLADANESNHAAFFDYDRDGDLDMYLLNGGGFEKSPLMVRPIIKDGSNRNNDRLYQNNFDMQLGHAYFTDVTLESGIIYEGFGLGLAIIDANEDGWPDIYVSNDYLSRDLLYVNQKDGKFIEKASDYFDHTSYFSMGSDVGDINNDGHMDLMTLDMLPADYFKRKMMFGPDDIDKFNAGLQYGYGYQYMRNMLHLNNGGGSFSEIGNLLNIAKSDWSWCPLIADFDNDGHQDVYVTNGFGKDLTDLDFVKFRREARGPFDDPNTVKNKLLSALEKQSSISPSNFLFKNDGDLNFSDVTQHWGCNYPSISSGAVYEDLDMDGDLDIVVNNINQDAFLFKNKLNDINGKGSQFIKIQLKGSQDNSQGIGAVVEVHTKDKVQYKNVMRSRGFQSSIGDKLHFGLGIHQHIDSIIVKWSDGRESKRYNVITNQVVKLEYKNSILPIKNNYPKKPMFDKVNNIDFVHKEGTFIDQKNQVLLQHGFSNQGPAIAVGDINGDQFDDVFVGGAYGQSAALYIQNGKSQFTQEVLSTEDYEDLGVIMIDIEQDGDLDLYVASGGSERYNNHVKYQDRIYLNNGRGKMTYDSARLPRILVSTASVSAGDIDQDGDQDLFIGGRIVPGRFPEAPQSYILLNDKGYFKDVTDRYSTTLKNIGMVTASLWTDFNNDGNLDLMVVGEMMKVHLFKNDQGKLAKVSEQMGLDQTDGLWNSINGGDLDNDGDIDYVLGNIGLNTSYQVSKTDPLSIHFADFDKNGSIDPIYSSVESGVRYPIASLDLLSQQLPILKKKYLNYKNFAKANLNDILDVFPEKKYKKIECKLAHSIILENNGDAGFLIHKLPRIAQVAPTNGSHIRDVNDDGLLDILMVGNNYDTEVVHGRYDAHKGMVLINQGNFTFDLADKTNSGFETYGNCKSIASTWLANGAELFLVGTNDASLQNFHRNQKLKPNTIMLAHNENSILFQFKNGSKRKDEYYYGCGYLSQSSRKIEIPKYCNLVSVFNTQNKETRKINIH